MHKKRVLLIFGFCFFPSLPAPEKPHLPQKYQKWIEEEVAYITTPREKRAFLKLESDRERDLFIEEFWRQRDLTPGTSRNEFKEEHYRRIEYANKAFRRDSSISGWRTDRGRVYIMLGEPAQIERFRSGEIHPTDLWYYEGNPRSEQAPIFRLLFFQRGGVGEYKLYNPITDGPRSLTPLIAFGDQIIEDDEADKLIRNRVSQELADASWSCFPGSARLPLPSAILLGQIYTYPQQRVKDDYVYEFLEHKATVDVSYSVNHIGNRHEVSVLRDESGLSFVNYFIEPEVLSVESFEDDRFAELKVTLRVTDSRGKTVFQEEPSFPIELREEQFRKIGRRPFHLYDSFPLIPGDYKVNILLENTVSKEFTSVEEDISVPEADALAITSLILARKVEKNSPYAQVIKPYQLGSLQVYPVAGNRFGQKDTLFLFLQILGLGAELREAGALEFTFTRGEEILLSRNRRIREYESDRNFLQEFSLDGFPTGECMAEIAVVDGEGNKILAERRELMIQASPVPESWIITQTGPPADDPLYSYLLGNQYLAKRDAARARSEFEKAYRRSPDSLDYALGYSRALSASNEYGEIRKILSPFAEAGREHFLLFSYLGKAYQVEGKLEEAVSFYRKALAHRGNVVEVLNSIGECYYFLGDEAEALKAWEKSLELNPNQEKIRKVIGVIKEKK